MNKSSLILFVTLVLIVTTALATLPTQNSTTPIFAQDAEDILTSVLVEEAPILDGIADEAFWADAPVFEIDVDRGANDDEKTVFMRSVYTEDSVYFLLEWADPTESFLRSPWEMQEDGSWVQLKDPDDMGGDNNVWYEDKLSFIWSINNSIAYFDEDGCGIACHLSEEGDPKPYGNKFTEEEGEMGDIWHWKSVRNLNQLHDQYLDNTEYSEDTPSAGRHSDPSESGGYVNNVNEDKTAPMYMLPGDDVVHDGSPGYLLESEMVPFDPAVFEVGDRVPGIYKSPFVGDGGDISGGWLWEDGKWTLEVGRLLVTGSEYDVQFDDLSAMYFFGIAPFDNAQVRHSYHKDPIFFLFEQ